ncbi:MAG: type II secretion system protein, partial [Candidatus Taylorbacteria bacterium]|nr:type II secretion system protein [Candidatus Taylorbacteria bacterium]
MFKDFFLKFRNSKGLTLIEILVTASLIVFTTAVVIRNFRASRLDFERVANVMASDIRLAQQLALSSHQHRGSLDPVPRNRCGYGITKTQSGGPEATQAECADGVDNDGDTFIDSSDPGCNRLYHIYAGPPTIKPDGTPGSCGSANYQTPNDTPYYKTVVLDSRIDFVDTPAPKDIFYKPPGPTTYINNGSTPSNLADPITYYEVITIKKVGVTKQNCTNGSL